MEQPVVLSVVVLVLVYLHFVYSRGARRLFSVYWMSRNTLSRDLQIVNELIVAYVETTARPKIRALALMTDTSDLNLNDLDRAVNSNEIDSITTETVQWVYTHLGVEYRERFETHYFRNRDRFIDYLTSIVYIQISKIGNRENVSKYQKQLNTVQDAYRHTTKFAMVPTDLRKITQQNTDKM
jgi:hypothetical protein